MHIFFTSWALFIMYDLLWFYFIRELHQFHQLLMLLFFCLAKCLSNRVPNGIYIQLHLFKIIVLRWWYLIKELQGITQVAPKPWYFSDGTCFFFFSWNIKQAFVACFRYLLCVDYLTSYVNFHLLIFIVYGHSLKSLEQ